MNQKIRPNPSPREIREEGLSGLPETARAPDLFRAEADPDALNANAPAAPPGDWQNTPPEKLFPDQAAAARATHNEPNKVYGKPYVPSKAEQLFSAYTKALAEFKADYAGTRSLSKEKPYLEAKQAMIEAGLMKGDV